MNDETQELLRRLELATSTTPVDRSELDQETADMRESWLLLGRMLKGAESAEWSAVSAHTHSELWKVPVRQRRLHTWWLVGGLLSIATAVGVWWLAAEGTVAPSTPKSGAPLAQQPSSPASSTDRHGSSPSSVHDTESTIAPEAPDALWSSALAWEDDWEDGLSRTAQVVEEFHGRRPADAPMQWLESEFQELAREFDSSSL